MMSKVQPSLRAIARARGTFGVSINPNRSTTRVNVWPMPSMLHDSASRRAARVPTQW